MGFSIISRRPRGTVTALLCVVLIALAGPGGAQADTSPAATDVLFVFDTTVSMKDAIGEGQSAIPEAMSEIAGAMPDPRFGLVEVNDYDEVLKPGGFEYGIGEGHPAWKLQVPFTAERSQIAAGMLKLSADGGGDSPEAYGRALFESATNPAVGWRAGARGVIVLVADNVPHDDDLNEGIPPEALALPSPFDTGVDPGADGMVGSGDDLDWQDTVLPTLAAAGKRLEYVDYLGAPQYLPYWQSWTARAGGSVVQAAGSDLAAKIVGAVEAGAGIEAPSCAASQVLTASGECATAATATPAAATPPPSGPPASPPSTPPSNNFASQPQASCTRGCRAVLVKIAFESSGSLAAESINKARVEKLSRLVAAGPNTLKLKLTGPAIAALEQKGKLKLPVRFAFTPDGGSARVQAETYSVKLPKKPRSA